MDIGGEIGGGHFLGVSIYLCAASSQRGFPITFLPSLLFLELLFLTPQSLAWVLSFPCGTCLRPLLPFSPFQERLYICHALHISGQWEEGEPSFPNAISRQLFFLFVKIFLLRLLLSNSPAHQGHWYLMTLLWTNPKSFTTLVTSGIQTKSQGLIL